MCVCTYIFYFVYLKFIHDILWNRFYRLFLLYSHRFPEEKLSAKKIYYCVFGLWVEGRFLRLFNKNFPRHLSKRAANPFTSSLVIPILQANVKYGCVYSFVDCPQQRKVQVPMVFVDFLSTTRVPAGINVYTRNFLIVG